MVSEREVLVVGGTGMLRPAVHDLLGAGVRVIAVARRPGRAATGTALDEQLVPVAADWSDPVGLAEGVRSAVAGRPLDEAVLWVHTPYDEGVHDALDPLLASDAVVVQLWGSSAVDPRQSRPRPAVHEPPRRYRSVILGFADSPAGTRWLTDREISDAALRGLRDPEPEQVAGRVDPWSDRP